MGRGKKSHIGHPQKGLPNKNQGQASSARCSNESNNWQDGFSESMPPEVAGFLKRVNDQLNWLLDAHSKLKTVPVVNEAELEAHAHEISVIKKDSLFMTRFGNFYFQTNSKMTELSETWIAISGLSSMNEIKAKQVEIAELRGKFEQIVVHVLQWIENMKKLIPRNAPTKDFVEAWFSGMMMDKHRDRIKLNKYLFDGLTCFRKHLLNDGQWTDERQELYDSVFDARRDLQDMLDRRLAWIVEMVKLHSFFLEAAIVDEKLRRSETEASTGNRNYEVAFMQVHDLFATLVNLRQTMHGMISGKAHFLRLPGKKEEFGDVWRKLKVLMAAKMEKMWQLKGTEAEKWKSKITDYLVQRLHEKSFDACVRQEMHELLKSSTTLSEEEEKLTSCEGRLPEDMSLTILDVDGLYEIGGDKPPKLSGDKELDMDLAVGHSFLREVVNQATWIKWKRAELGSVGDNLDETRGIQKEIKSREKVIQEMFKTMPGSKTNPNETAGKSDCYEGIVSHVKKCWESLSKDWHGLNNLCSAILDDLDGRGIAVSVSMEPLHLASDGSEDVTLLGGKCNSEMETESISGCTFSDPKTTQPVENIAQESIGRNVGSLKIGRSKKGSTASSTKGLPNKDKAQLSCARSSNESTGSMPPEVIEFLKKVDEQLVWLAGALSTTPTATTLYNLGRAVYGGDLVKRGHEIAGLKKESMIIMNRFKSVLGNFEGVRLNTLELLENWEKLSFLCNMFTVEAEEKEQWTKYRGNYTNLAKYLVHWIQRMKTLIDRNVPATDYTEAWFFKMLHEKLEHRIGLSEHLYLELSTLQKNMVDASEWNEEHAKLNDSVFVARFELQDTLDRRSAWICEMIQLHEFYIRSETLQENLLRGEPSKRDYKKEFQSLRDHFLTLADLRQMKHKMITSDVHALRTPGKKEGMIELWGKLKMLLEAKMEKMGQLRSPEAELWKSSVFIQPTVKNIHGNDYDPTVRKELFDLLKRYFTLTGPENDLATCDVRQPNDVSLEISGVKIGGAMPPKLTADKEMDRDLAAGHSFLRGIVNEAAWIKAKRDELGFVGVNLDEIRRIQKELQLREKERQRLRKTMPGTETEVDDEEEKSACYDEIFDHVSECWERMSKDWHGLNNLCNSIIDELEGATTDARAAEEMVVVDTNSNESTSNDDAGVLLGNMGSLEIAQRVTVTTAMASRKSTRLAEKKRTAEKQVEAFTQQETSTTSVKKMVEFWKRKLTKEGRQVIGPRDIFKAPGLNKIAIDPDTDEDVKVKVEPQVNEDIHMVDESCEEELMQCDDEMENLDDPVVFRTVKEEIDIPNDIESSGGAMETLDGSDRVVVKDENFEDDVSPSVG